MPSAWLRFAAPASSMNSGLAGGSAPWTPGGYIPVVNILFIPVPNILFIPVPNILFIPVPNILFIPVPNILFIPVPNILFIPVANTSFIPVSHPSSQSAAQSLSQFYIFQFYILISSASRIQIAHVTSSNSIISNTVHSSPSPNTHYIMSHHFFLIHYINPIYTCQKSYQYYHLKPNSLLSFFLNIIYLHFFFTSYILSPSPFLPLSPSFFHHFHIYPFSCLSTSTSIHIHVYITIINLNLIFHSPLLFLCLFYFIPISTFIKPFLLSSIMVFTFMFICFPV